MSEPWRLAHSRREVLLKKLYKAIVKAVQNKHPYMSEDEAMDHFIKSTKKS